MFFVRLRQAIVDTADLESTIYGSGARFVCDRLDFPLNDFFGHLKNELLALSSRFSEIPAVNK